MIHRKTHTSIYLAGAAVNCADLLTPEELRHRMATECHNDLRLDGSNLPIKVVVTCLNLFRFGITVFRGTALHHVCNEYVCSLHVDARQQFVQELSSRSNEWAPLLIFV